MTEKITYLTPELTVIELSETDLVTTSLGGSNGFDGEVDDDWGSSKW